MLILLLMVVVGVRVVVVDVDVGLLCFVLLRLVRRSDSFGTLRSYVV